MQDVKRLPFMYFLRKILEEVFHQNEAVNNVRESPGIRKAEDPNEGNGKRESHA